MSVSLIVTYDCHYSCVLSKDNPKRANIVWLYSFLTNSGRDVWALSQSTTILFQE